VTLAPGLMCADMTALNTRGPPHSVFCSAYDRTEACHSGRRWRVEVHNAEAGRTLRYVSSSIHQTKRSAKLSQGFSTVAYPPSAAREYRCTYTACRNFTWIVIVITFKAICGLTWCFSRRPPDDKKSDYVSRVGAQVSFVDSFTITPWRTLLQIRCFRKPNSRSN
jgi:hypothetical protein